FALKSKAHEVYEKLAVLAYVEEYLTNTPNPEYTKEELLDLVEKAEKKATNESTSQSHEETVVSLEATEEYDQEKTEEQELNDSEDEDAEAVKEDAVSEGIELTLEDSSVNSEVHEEVEDLFSQSEQNTDESSEGDSEILEPSEEETPISLEDELKDTIAVDVVADLFENAPKKSLNDKIRNDIQIGLNDRIAFVKNLFGGSQEDFNRVVSQLNSFKTEKEAKKFINKMVKPDYNWADNEEIEQRFMSIVERKFL
ncbi:MAG: hypothetical protein ACPG6C_07295, partial [Flavobacteriaceae bacterium]